MKSTPEIISNSKLMGKNTLVILQFIASVKRGENPLFEGKDFICITKKVYKKALHQNTLNTRRETAEDICKLLDDIELKQEFIKGSTLGEWKQWKHIRNAIRDKYKPLQEEK